MRLLAKQGPVPTDIPVGSLFAEYYSFVETRPAV